MVRVACQVVCHTEPPFFRVATSPPGQRALPRCGVAFAASPVTVSKIYMAFGYWELRLLDANRVSDLVNCWIPAKDLERCFHINDVLFVTGDPGEDLNAHVPVTRTVSIPGDSRTFVVKEELKLLGGLWNPEERKWILPFQNEAAARLLLEGAERATNHAQFQTNLSDYLQGAL